MRYLLAGTLAAFLLMVLGVTGGCNKTENKPVNPNTNAPEAPKDDSSSGPKKGGAVMVPSK